MKIKQNKGLLTRRKKIGADGVIIIGVDFTGGSDSTPFLKSEAIKYKNQAAGL